MSHESRTSHQSLSRVPEDEPKKNTINSYKISLSRFSNDLGDWQLDSISSEEILPFLTSITEGSKQATKHSRHSHLGAFFNFSKINTETTTSEVKVGNSICRQFPLLEKLFLLQGSQGFLRLFKVWMRLTLFKDLDGFGDAVLGLLSPTFCLVKQAQIELGLS